MEGPGGGFQHLQQGSLNGTHLGGIKQAANVVILRDFP